MKGNIFGAEAVFSQVEKLLDAEIPLDVVDVSVGYRIAPYRDEVRFSLEVPGSLCAHESRGCGVDGRPFQRSRTKIRVNPRMPALNAAQCGPTIPPVHATVEQILMIRSRRGARSFLRAQICARTFLFKSGRDHSSLTARQVGAKHLPKEVVAVLLAKNRFYAVFLVRIL